jgi:hypothetical protein
MEALALTAEALSDGQGETLTFALPQPWSFAWISLNPNLGVTEK